MNLQTNQIGPMMISMNQNLQLNKSKRIKKSKESFLVKDPKMDFN